jgi:hypothetical protein
LRCSSTLLAGTRATSKSSSFTGSTSRSAGLRGDDDNDDDDDDDYDDMNDDVVLVVAVVVIVVVHY